MINLAGNRISLLQNSSAVQLSINFVADQGAASVADSTSAEAWPIIFVVYFYIRSTTMVDCGTAEKLLEFIVWTQTSSASIDLITFLSLFVTPISWRRQLLLLLGDVTCNGNLVLLDLPCLLDGEICSNHGTCLDGKCICELGYSGTVCQTNDLAVQSSSDTSTIIGLSVGLPVGFLFLLLLLGVLLLAGFMYYRKKMKRTDRLWMVNWNELEIGEQIGTGSYGAVHKAEWNGSEVAVKMMISTNVTKEMRQSFIEEVQIMTELRHPHVVLFMGAVTTPPNMCIIMEYMPMGSLYDVLHNEHITNDILKSSKRLKMALQVARGMNYLHSSNIIHRDLKSLNLLLDEDWNVKISDFGLTKYKSQLAQVDEKENEKIGSIYWTAPEVLEDPSSYSKHSDVYSYGIILWELATRKDPFDGMAPTAVAVGVLRDKLTPTIPEGLDEGLTLLMENCWSHDPTTRPDFGEVISRLQIHAHGSRSASSMSGSGLFWGLSSSSGTGESSNSSDNAQKGEEGTKMKVLEGPPPPEGEMTLAFSDIHKASVLWEFCPEAMKDATLMHNKLLRDALKEFKGYEVTLMKDGGGEGSFCMAFQKAHNALKWAVAVQERLMDVDWPAKLLEHPAAAEEWDAEDNKIFRGLRIRIGMHYGAPRTTRDALTRRVEFIGPVVNKAARITTLAAGGQILFSKEMYDQIKNWSKIKTLGQPLRLGKMKVTKEEDEEFGQQLLYEFRPLTLLNRFFEGRAATEKPQKEGNESRSNSQSYSGSGSSSLLLGPSTNMKEDAFLNSANLARWIINFKQLELGKQIGVGSYGVVYRAKWKGVDVAVKKFMKQKLPEKRMLEFRAEVASLSELHHPNIIMFIGACVKPPNLCIVTEYMKKGNLRDILRDKTIQLPWKLRMKIARSIALALNYLHTLDPVIIHRDLKSSNILVDENWGVKVADFGFARIKAENTTMTRCGTPCWTAPEILRGQAYDEKADIYSFGIVLWELVTRAHPYGERNFIGVTMDVLNGVRPAIPPSTNKDLAELIRECWEDNPKKRPKLKRMLKFFEEQIGSDAAIEEV